MKYNQSCVPGQASLTRALKRKLRPESTVTALGRRTDSILIALLNELHMLVAVASKLASWLHRETIHSMGSLALPSPTLPGLSPWKLGLGVPVTYTCYVQPQNVQCTLNNVYDSKRLGTGQSHIWEW